MAALLKFSFRTLTQTLLLIYLKLNRVMGHNQGLVAFEIGVGLFSCFGHALI